MEETPQSALQVEGLTKHFPGVTALENVSLHVGRQEIVGLVGENGAGKSTILNALSGSIDDWTGQVRLHGKPIRPRNYHQAALAGITRVFQEQALIPTLTVYENMFISHEDRFRKAGFLVDRRRMAEVAREELKGLGLEVDVTRPVGDYDFGTRQTIEIARAFGLSRVLDTGPPVLLLDEPTAALTQREMESFFGQLSQMKAAASAIFVSHRLSEVLAVSDRIYVLKDGRMVGEVNPGQTDESGLHELMVGRKRDRDYYKEDEQQPPGPEPLLQVKDLSKKGAFSGVSLELHPGEILGIGGVLGSGKTGLGRAIAGIAGTDAGKLILAGRVVSDASLQRMMREGVGYVPQERHEEGIILDLSLAFNLSLCSVDHLSARLPGFLNLRKEKEIADRFVKLLAIKSPSLSTLAGSLSGGNQQKVVLAKWLAREPRILILDNPTRGVDAGAKEEIYALLRRLSGQRIAIVLITDELLELIGMSNRILVMRDGRVTYEVAAPPSLKPTEQQLVRHMV